MRRTRLLLRGRSLAVRLEKEVEARGNYSEEAHPVRNIKGTDLGN